MRGGEPGLWAGLAPVCDDGLSARGKAVEVPDETTFCLGIGDPESVLPGRLWCISSDDNQPFHIYSGSDGYPTGNLGAIANAHNGSGSVSSEFSPALSADCLSSRAKTNKPLLYPAR